MNDPTIALFESSHEANAHRQSGQMVPGTSSHASPVTTGHDSTQATQHEQQLRRQRKAEYRRAHSTTGDSTQQSSPKQESPVSSEEGFSLGPTALDAHRRDLFGSYPIKLTGQSLEALDEQLHLVTNEELALNVRGGTQHPMLTFVFTRSLQDVGLFSCYVAAAQSLYQQRRSPKVFKPSDQLVGLQQQGLEHIMQRIKQPGAEMDDVLIASITQLMVADGVCGNVQSLASHQRGIRKLVGLRRDELHSTIFRVSLGVLVVIEFYIALMQFMFPTTKPTPPPAKKGLTYIRHPFPASICVRISRLPQGLEEVVISSRCSLQTIDLLEHLTQWSSAMHDVNGDSGRASLAFARLFAEPMDSSRSAIHILRHLRHANTEVGIEQLLCLGIIIIIKHQRQTRKTDYLDDELIHSFIRSLRQYPSTSPSEIATIVWLVAVITWRTGSMFKTYADELLDFTIQKYDQAQNVDTVRSIWRKFLWHQSFEGAWTRLWQTGLDRYRAKHPDPQRRIPLAKSNGLRRPDCSFIDGFSSLKKEDSNESSAHSSHFSRPPSTGGSHHSSTSIEEEACPS